MSLVIKNEQDFYYIARNFYNNGQGNTEEQFRQDMRLIASFKNQLKKYTRDGECDLRLLLNLYITLSNIFGIATDVMLRYRIPQEMHPYIAVFPALIKGKKEDPNCFSYELYNDIRGVL